MHFVNILSNASAFLDGATTKFNDLTTNYLRRFFAIQVDEKKALFCFAPLGQNPGETNPGARLRCRKGPDRE
jgi:hypothetical protein